MTWETDEACIHLVNSDFAESNLSADELKEMFEESIPESMGTIGRILQSFLSQAVAEVDWDEVAEAVSTEKTADPVKVDAVTQVWTNSEARVRTRSGAYVGIGHTVEQANGQQTGIVLAIYSTLKAPWLKRLVVQTEQGTQLWDASICRKIEEEN